MIYGLSEKAESESYKVTRGYKESQLLLFCPNSHPTFLPTLDHFKAI